MRLGLRGQRRDRGLRRDKAAVRLKHADEIVRKAERRKPPHRLRSGKHLVRQPVQPRGRERARDDVAVRQTDLGDAGDVQELGVLLAASSPRHSS